MLFLVPFPKPPGTHALSCELTLGCSVDYLLGQSRWSPRPSMVTNIGQVGVQVITYMIHVINTQDTYSYKLGYWAGPNICTVIQNSATHSPVKQVAQLNMLWPNNHSRQPSRDKAVSTREHAVSSRNQEISSDHVLVSSGAGQESQPQRSRVQSRVEIMKSQVETLPVSSP